MLVDGDHLVISDQETGEILRVPIDDPAAAEVVAVLPEPDLLALGPDGTWLTGGPDGDVRQVSSDGGFDVLVGGFQEVRGLAYDAANQRLFVVDHDGNDEDGTTHFLQIVPVP